MHKPYLILPLLAILITTGCGSIGLGGGSADDGGGASATNLTGTRGGPKVSDSEITASIKEAFKQDPELAATNLNVSANNGVVSLSGNVPNAQTYNRAISLARSVAGVRPPVKASELRFPQ
ncbi:MAG: BON domain-containing protein [Candidatus Competibacteraceae bacterium]|nr:BON domain-containing protein [Candidatus Competibacteraceae bacterium]